MVTAAEPGYTGDRVCGLGLDPFFSRLLIFNYISPNVKRPFVKILKERKLYPQLQTFVNIFTDTSSN